MKKALDPRDVYWSYRIENFLADTADEQLSLDLAFIGFDGWELVTTREYKEWVEIPSPVFARDPNRTKKTFIKYIFKRPSLPNEYNDE
jgi:hypothetical protein